jgi:hypothetical protein
MILNLGSLAFNANLLSGGGTPAWGTELGQGEGYKFSFEDMSDFFTGMVYTSVPDIEEVTCPLGKGGNQRADYDFVIASVFDKVYINGKQVEDGRFLLLVVKRLNGEHHVGRRTIKYNPRMTYRGEYINEDCYQKMVYTMGLPEDAAWFVYEIFIVNQDQLHFTAFELGKEPQSYRSIEERKNAFVSRLPKGEKHKYSLSENKAIIPLFRPYITAIKSKPFLLLAGISGTGKSRIVRELARACWNVDSNEYKAPKPRNFEMVQVKPNWHDSSELIGYVSRIDGERYVVGPFLKFLVKAMKEPDVPYFLCLDEMNLAPVEQYFAEYLSVVESRKCDGETVVTDSIIEYEATDAYKSLIDQLFYDDEETRLGMLKKEDGLRLTIPQNLIVVGTVNMDETTFSFSRKVLDRAMTIEMNEVDLKGGLSTRYEQIGKLGNKELVGTAVEGVDVYSQYQSVCDTAISYLQSVNDVLEGTPFKVAYRTRNEVLLYVVNNLPYSKDADGKDLPQEYVIARALDEITNMKILSRIEGDETKVTPHFLEELGKTIKEGLEHIFEGLFDKTASDDAYNSVSLTKLDEMTKRLSSGYTSFWS